MVSIISSWESHLKKRAFGGGGESLGISIKMAKYKTNKQWFYNYYKITRFNKTKNPTTTTKD